MTNIQARLDRGLANAGWHLLFPEAHISIYLLMQMRRRTDFHPRSFRFEGMWTLEKSSIDVIKQAWHHSVPGSPLFQMVCYVRNTELAMKKWNKTVFGKVQDHIKDLRS